MKITFNSLGAVIETITNDEPLRQGNVGNTLTAKFEGKYNGDYVASLTYKRSDGSVLPLSVFLKPSTTERDTYTFTFAEAWYFALYGQTLVHIDLTDARGNVVVSGEIKFDIEQTIYTSKPTINIDQYNELVTLIAGKMPIPEKAIVLEWGEELPEVGEPNTLYLKPTDETSDIYDRYWFNYSTQEYEYLGDTTILLSQYQLRSEKGKADGYVPLNQYGKVDTKYLSGSFLKPIYGMFQEEPNDFLLPDGTPAPKSNENIYIDIGTGQEYLYNEDTDLFFQSSVQIPQAINVQYSKATSGLDADNVQGAIDELASEKLNVKPLVWSALPEGATDKKTFYNKTIATLRTANNKIYMWGAPEETPIKEFFDIWGKPTDFKATHVYIVIESISNETKRDSFKMTIHSSNYANMYCYVASGYNSQLVGNGSGWVNYNLLNADRQKQLAKIDGLYELMTVGFALGLINPIPQKTNNSSFISQITADNEAIENGVAIVNVIGGNTIVENQHIKFENGTETINGNLKVTKENGKVILEGEANKLTKINFTVHCKPGIYLLKGAPQGKSGMTTHFLLIEDLSQCWDFGNGVISEIAYERNVTVTIFIQSGEPNERVIYEPQFINLTQWFGAGNEPKVAETGQEAYNRGVPTEYIPYNDGTLKNATPTGIKSIGTNLCDNEFESGGFQNDNGAKYEGTKEFRIKNFISVLSNLKYTLVPLGFTCTNAYLLWFESEDKFIRTDCLSGNFGDIRLTAPSNARYCKFYFYNDGAEFPIPEDPQVMLVIGDQAPTTYTPYMQDIENIDITPYFPQGMNGVNNVRDTIEKDKATKRLGVVDLGTLNWSIGSGTNGWFKATFNKAKVIDNDTIPNAIIPNYEPTTSYTVGHTARDKVFSVGNENEVFGIVLKDTQYANNLAEFKKHINGVMLVYELAEPVITDIADTLDLRYKVEIGGIETWDSEVPVYTEIVYKKDLVLKLARVRTREEQEQIDTEQDRRIGELERDIAHYSADTKSVMIKHKFIGDMHDVNLYNQVVNTPNVMDGALFSIETKTDTPTSALNNGFPFLESGTIVYGYFFNGLLDSPMVVITPKGTYKIIDGGALTCEKVSGLNAIEIDYTPINDLSVQLDKTSINTMFKGVKVWVDVNVGGIIVNVCKEYEFTKKSNADICVLGQIIDERRVAKPIMIRYNKTNGIADIYSEANIPSNTYKIVDVKGLI